MRSQASQSRSQGSSNHTESGVNLAISRPNMGPLSEYLMVAIRLRASENHKKLCTNRGYFSWYSDTKLRTNQKKLGTNRTIVRARRSQNRGHRVGASQDLGAGHQVSSFISKDLSHLPWSDTVGVFSPPSSSRIPFRANSLQKDVSKYIPLFTRGLRVGP